jgi:hypothetical protein
LSDFFLQFLIFNFQFLILNSKHSRFGAAESAFIEIKRFEVRFEIDVNPIDIFFFRKAGRRFDKLLPDSAMLVNGVNGRVQKKRVLPAVPGEIDETDQTLCVIGADKSQTLL